VAGTEVAPGVFTELTPEQRERAMRTVVYATVVGVLFFFSIYGSVLFLFARKLGASETIIGLLAALIPMSVLIQVPLARDVETRGKKRLLIPAWALTAAISVPLVLIPFLPAARSLRLGVLVAVVALTALMRQPALVAWMPLLSDIIPTDIRGRFFGRMRTAWQSSALILTLSIAMLFGKEAAWWQFQVVFSIGILSVLVRLPIMRRIPELAPRPEARNRGRFSFVGEALRDRSFACFAVLVGLVSLMAMAMSPHVVVYMRDVLAYRDDFIIVSTQALPLLGAITTLVLWGHLADRIGTRAILIFTSVGTALTTLVWLFIVPGSVAGQVVLAVSLFARGLMQAGFGIAAVRFVYGALPRNNKTGYLATHTVAMSLGLGLGPLLAGLVLNHTSGFGVSLLGLSLDNYKVLFAATALGMVLPLALLAWVRTPGEAPTREFLNFLFYRPLRTTVDLVRYHRPLGEERRAAVTRRLATSTSAVTLRELLGGLDDPSYPVRQAAAHGLALRRQPGVVRALMAKLEQEDSLIRPSVIWALGELRASEALEVLSGLLAAPDRHARSQAALALGKIGRPDAVAALEDRWQAERDLFVRACVATALGRLGSTHFVPDALYCLTGETPEVIRRQLATAIGSLLPGVGDFYHVLRGEIHERGTAARHMVRRALRPPRARSGRAGVDAATVRPVIRALWQAYVRRQDDEVVRVAVRAVRGTAEDASAAPARDVLRALAALHADEVRAATSEEALLALAACCAVVGPGSANSRRL